MAVGDYLCGLNIFMRWIYRWKVWAKIGFHKMSRDYWRMLERERKRETEGKERESGPAAILGIPLIWSYVSLLGGLMSPFFFPHLTKQPRAYIICKRHHMSGFSLIWFSVNVYTSLRRALLSWAGVIWITYSGYLFPTVGLTLSRHLKDMRSFKRYGLLSWFLLFFLKHFFTFYLGLYQISGHSKLNTERSNSVVKKKNK